MANTEESKQVVARFWAAMHANDFRAAGELLHDEYLLEWPQSGERIRGRENFVAVNEQYPAEGRWSVMLHRLLGEGGEVVTEVTVTDGVGITGRAITFSTVRDGKIARQTEYWPDSFEAAAWRARWVERAIDMRTLGATGLPVSPIGLGLAALGRPGYINLGHADDLGREYDVAAMRGRAHAALDAAWAAGVRYFDAARSYGRAEEFLGSWLRARSIPPGELTVGSKWGYTYTANWRVHAEVHEVKDHSLPVLLRQWGETQANLGGYLRLYQVHSATLDSGVMGDHAVLAELARLKGQGVAIGLSLSGPEQAAALDRALAIEVGGARLFDTVQATWNLLEPSAGPALARARAAGMGVIVKEALANGRLTARNDDPAFAERRALLERQATRLGATLDALALAAVLAQPWADVVLSGAATVEQVHSNLGALHVAWDGQAAAELAELAEQPRAYWDARKRLPWA
jgi:aryl-alcohol dehydrogenase-like predicted oxidoreductase/ketosteroid isomerase-like protein